MWRHKPTTVLLAASVVMLLVSFPALALNIVGTNGNDSLRGTAKSDRINGRGGNDRILGLAGNDTLIGGPGRDFVDGGAGDDRLVVRDGVRDTANCGVGRDRVTADASDVIRANCETVLRPTPPPPPQPPIGTSRENPIPLGRAANVGNGWTVTVTNVYPDATAQVLAANQFNDPPGPGRQFFMIAVSATYNGAGSSRLRSSFSMRAVGASQVAYTTFNNSCGVLPEPEIDLDDPEVFTGGSVSGNAACWSVLSSDAGSLVMFYEPIETQQRTWFALR